MKNMLAALTVLVAIAVVSTEAANAQNTETVWVNGDPVTFMDAGNGFEVVRAGGQTFHIMRLGNLVQVTEVGGTNNVGFGGSGALALLNGYLQGQAERQKRELEQLQAFASNPAWSEAERWCLETIVWAGLDEDFAKTWKPTCGPVLRSNELIKNFLMQYTDQQ